MRRALAFAVVAGLAASALAFIPPARFILKKLAARLSPLRGVTATLAGFQVAAGAADSGQAATGRLYLGAPDRFRLEVHAAGDTRVEVWAGGSRSTRVGEQARTEVASGTHPVTGLFLGGNVAAMLREWGIDSDVVTLGRLDPRYICWVIGAAAEDPTRPQLWVDKETFLPVRLLVFDGRGDARRAHDWRFYDYDLADPSTPFPRSIEIRVDGRRVLRAAVQKLDVRAVPRESLFSSTAPEGR